MDDKELRAAVRKNILANARAIEKEALAVQLEQTEETLTKNLEFAIRLAHMAHLLDPTYEAPASIDAPVTTLALLELATDILLAVSSIGRLEI